MAARILTAAPAAAASILAFVERQCPGCSEHLVSAVLGGPLSELPDARVPAAVIPGLLAAAIERTGRSDLPVALAANSELRRFGVLAYALSTSSTLGDAYVHTARFLALWNEGLAIALVTADAGPALELRPRLPGPRDDLGRRALLELSSAALVAAGREATGVDFEPRLIELDATAPGDPIALARYARCTVVLGTAVTRIALDPTTLSLPLIGADQTLAAIVRAHAEDQLARLGATETWGGRARATLISGLGHGRIELPEVARQLHVSTRTLQRRLAEEGVRFADLLDDVRRELALRYLGSSTLGIGEVAYLLGFAELSAFYHAFRRWTGTTPAAWRRERLAGEDKKLAAPGKAPRGRPR